MATLVREVVGIEEEAESIIADAHAEAKRLEKAYNEEVSAYRKNISDETNRKIEAFRKDVEEANKKALQDEKTKLDESLDALNGISQDIINSQVEIIVSRLLNS